MNAPAPLLQQIVAVFDPYAPDAAVLQLALRLAAGGTPRVQGLYVDEIDVLTLGALPWAQEVALATGRASAMAAEALERELGRRAATAQALFESGTSGLALAHFERVRGPLAGELARFAGHAAAILLGWPPAARRSRSWARATLRTLLGLPVPLAGLVATTPAAAGILVVHAGVEPGAGYALARRLTAAAEGRITVQRAPASALQVIGRARLESAGTLVVERDVLLAAPELLEELAARWSGSLLLPA